MIWRVGTYLCTLSTLNVTSREIGGLAKENIGDADCNIVIQAENAGNSKSGGEIVNVWGFVFHPRHFLSILEFRNSLDRIAFL